MTMRMAWGMALLAAFPALGAGKPSEGTGGMPPLAALREWSCKVNTDGGQVVWGGEEKVKGKKGKIQATFRGDGRVYDASKGTWRAMSMEGAPSPRSGHAAAWLPSVGAVFIWGGWDGEKVLGNGALYYPKDDVWKPVSLAGAPAARYDYTAVGFPGMETGDDGVIIWGGVNAEGYPLDSGGIYSVKQGVWTPTAIMHAPMARHGHKAEWDNESREMAVWGGWYGNGRVCTGGRFSPAPFLNFWRMMYPEEVAERMKECPGTWIER